MKMILAAALAIATLSGPAFAQGIEVSNTALVEVKTIDADGEERLSYIAPDKVSPGDTILYRINYKNTGSAPAEAVVLTSEIPAALTITEGTAGSVKARVHYSVDGGASFAERGELTVIGADGKRRPAEAEDLTNVRWNMLAPLPAGKQDTVSYRAVVK